MSETTSGAALHAMHSAIDARDWGSLARLLHPRATLVAPGGARFEGADAVLDYYRAVRGIESGRHFIEGLLAEVDRAVSWGRFDGVRRDGQPISMNFSDMVRFEDGLILERRVLVESRVPHV
jgi:ketosteroid isomerase-like protein